MAAGFMDYEGRTEQEDTYSDGAAAGGQRGPWKRGQLPAALFQGCSASSDPSEE